MNYKYVYDSNMPQCYEKAFKKLRCVLQFYIMNIDPEAKLMDETRSAIEEMGLSIKPADILQEVKQSLKEVKN